VEVKSRLESLPQYCALQWVLRVHLTTGTAVLAMKTIGRFERGMERKKRGERGTIDPC
jgi:hypothetical protein